MGRAALSLSMLSLLLLACTPKVPPSHQPSLPLDRPIDLREGILHRVAPGESWSDIARDYYDDEGAVKRLRNANPSLGPDLALDLATGREIFVPLSGREREVFARRARSRAPYNLGLAHVRAGDYPEAIIQFREALRQDERFAPAQYNLGLAYRRAGQRNLATEALARAVKLDSGRADYSYALGLSYLDREDPANAAASFRSALKRDERHLASIYALARLYDDRGRPGLALDLWRRYFSLDPDSARGVEAGHRLERAR